LSSLRKLIAVLICISLAASIFAGTAEAKAVRHVAAVPFTIYAEKDLAFLQKGIQVMLTSRLSQEGKVVVLGEEVTAEALKDIQGQLNPEKAASIGRALGADYVLYGSLTVFGESVSVDAKMVDVSGGRTPLSFFTQGDFLGEVIPGVDRFAAQINEELFGRKSGGTAASESSRKAVGQAAGAREVHAHPEALIQGGFEETDEGKVTTAGFGMGRAWRSRSFRELIIGMDLGDVDADGKIETVLATPDKVLIYRLEDQRFFEVGRIEVPGYRSVVGLDVGDINGNGIEEIFVSALNGQKNRVQSLVCEYEKGSYVSIVENAPWYFRVIRQTDLGKQLYGQRQKMGETPFEEPIHRLTWDKGGYVSQNRMLPGGKANVLGFSMGRLTPDADELALVYSPNDRLQILEPNGWEFWTGADPFGGSLLFLNLPVENRGAVEKKSYFPMRIRSRDLNGDETQEVIVAQNQEVANRRLQQRRNFLQTQLFVLSWDGIGLGGIWKTRPLSGHIRDLALGDFDGDGIDELVAVLVSEEGSVVGMKPKSGVIAFDILQR